MEDIGSLERHQLSAIFGNMDEEERLALENDVAEHGVKTPITLYEGKVLDGWHRLQAALKCGEDHIPIDPEEPEDPAAFVIRANALRRHLTAERRAAITLQVTEWAGPGTNQHGRVGHNDPPTNAELARKAGVSPATIKRVKRRIREGHGEALARGETTLSELAKEEREKLAMKDTVTRPLTRMERLEAETERLRVDRGTALEKLKECEQEVAALTRERARGGVNSHSLAEVGTTLQEGSGATTQGARALTHEGPDQGSLLPDYRPTPYER